MVRQQQQGEEEQPLVGPPPVKRGRGRPRKVQPLEGASLVRPGKATAASSTTTNKCSVRITASEREIAEAKEEEAAVRENGEEGVPVDSKGVVSRRADTPPPLRPQLPPQVKVVVDVKAIHNPSVIS